MLNGDTLLFQDQMDISVLLFLHREEDTLTIGGRFSKSANERMSMLQERKQLMVDHARRLGHEED